jgi:hypothetical protein
MNTSLWNMDSGLAAARRPRNDDSQDCLRSCAGGGTVAAAA